MDTQEANAENNAMLVKLMHQIETDKVSTQLWNTRSLLLIYGTLIAVILLELENVNIIIISAVAVLGLLAFWALGRIRAKALEKQAPEKEMPDDKQITSGETHRVVEEPLPNKSILSDREIQILQLIAEGNMNKQVARELGISHATVRNHVSRIMQKLDVTDRTSAVVMALSNGWIDINRPSKDGGSTKPGLTLEPIIKN